MAIVTKPIAHISIERRELKPGAQSVTSVLISPEQLAEFSALAEQLETVTAQRDALRDALAELLRDCRRDGGYVEHDRQVLRRRIEAMIVEAGGTIARRDLTRRSCP